MSNVLDALISRVNTLDPALANEISAEVKKLKNKREYGLVYEPHAPEGVRLWGKKVQVGDVVHILPPRGMMESKDNYIEWKVVSVKKGIVHVIRKSDDGENIEQEVSVDDVVAYADFRQPIYPGLVEAGRVERGGKDAPYHVLINGENFHALQAMLWFYEGKVDCIYIDPPYNTGAKDWKYNNDYVDGNDQYKHSKWLSFMEQRLKLAKKLLNPKNSVMIVTIDEKEYLRLGMLLEQLFSEARIQMISSVINSSGVNRSNEFARSNEFIYIIQFGNSCPVLLNLSDDWKGNTRKNKANNVSLYWNQLMRSGSNSSRIHSEGAFYPIYLSLDGKKIVSIGKPLGKGVNRELSPNFPNTIKIFPIRSNGTEGCWQLGPQKLNYAYSKGYVKFGKLRGNKISITYLADGEQKKIEQGIIKIIGYRDDGSVIEQKVSKNDISFLPTTSWDIPSHNATYFGTQLNLKLFPDRKFPYPKSLYAVEDVLRFFVANNRNALIVDFFAGSGTTAHATMLLNHLDGGHRQCISITNNEVGPDNEKQFVKQGLRPIDIEWQSKGIAHYITWERIKAAITGIATNGEPIKGNYKFTEEFPMSDGFKENAVFFDLKYEDGKAIRLNMAFKDIAPLLWMRAGGKGRIIQDISPTGYDIAEQYAVLFDYSVTEQFLSEIRGKDIKVVYIVTDSESLYQQIYKRLPRGIEPVRLYENYLTSFAMYGVV